MQKLISVNLDSQITTHFKWREALFLNNWGICVYPNEEQHRNIILIANKAEIIRGLYNKPMIVRSWLRTPHYNFSIGGAKHSWHQKGGAIDFKIDGIHSSTVRADLASKLNDLEIRMEKLEQADDWVHIDNKTPGNARYFIP